jgi:hypothetical protein
VIADGGGSKVRVVGSSCLGEGKALVMSVGDELRPEGGDGSGFKTDRILKDERADGRSCVE